MEGKDEELMNIITQGYPLWLVDEGKIRMIVGWEKVGEDEHRPISVSLGGPSCVAETDLNDDLLVYPTLEMAQRAVGRSKE
jgi:hypothetical protein